MKDRNIIKNMKIKVPDALLRSVAQACLAQLVHRNSAP